MQSLQCFSRDEVSYFWGIFLECLRELSFKYCWIWLNKIKAYDERGEFGRIEEEEFAAGINSFHNKRLVKWLIFEDICDGYDESIEHLNEWRRIKRKTIEG